MTNEEVLLKLEEDVRTSWSYIVYNQKKEEEHSAIKNDLPRLKPRL